MWRWFHFEYAAAFDNVTIKAIIVRKTARRFDKLEARDDLIE